MQRKLERAARPTIKVEVCKSTSLLLGVPAVFPIPVDQVARLLITRSQTVVSQKHDAIYKHTQRWPRVARSTAAGRGGSASSADFFCIGAIFSSGSGQSQRAKGCM